MPVATFDTLKFSKALREAGVPEKQADAEAVVFAEVFSLNLKEVTTKDDLKQLEERIDFKFREYEQRRKTDHDALVTKQASDMTLVKWMFGVLVTICSGIAVRLLLFPGK